MPVRSMSLKTEIKAVHSHDVERLLKKYDQYEAFVENRITCYVCGRPVNADNMASLRRSGDKLEFACEDASCYGAVLKGMASK